MFRHDFRTGQMNGSEIVQFGSALSSTKLIRRQSARSRQTNLLDEVDDFSNLRR